MYVPAYICHNTEGTDFKMTLFNWKNLKVLSLPTEQEMCYRYVANCLHHIANNEKKYFYITWLMGLAVKPKRDSDKRIYKFR